MNLNFYNITTNLTKFSSQGIKAVLSTFLLLALISCSSLFAQIAPSAPTNVTATPSAVCSGSSTNLKAISAGNQIRWYVDATGGSFIGVSNSGANLSVSPTESKTYYAESYNSTSGLSSPTRTAIAVSVNIPPQITSVPANVSQNNQAGRCGATVFYPEVTVTGIPYPSVIYSNPSGSDFEIGTTTVLTTAVNTCGSSSLSFDVTVNDNESPTIITPPSINITAPAGASSLSNVDLGSPTVTDNCGSVSISNNAPSVFYGGTTIVTWIASDNHGHSASATQSVIVTLSNTAPTFSVSPTSSVGNTMATGSTTTLSISWNDENGGGPYTVEFDWNDGSAHTIVSGISSHNATASHTYTASGVYEPTVKVTDGGGLYATTSLQYLAVYVTGNQFATGGGFFYPPAGSLTSNPSLTGKVNFGSNCKPKNTGGFQGEMELNFQAANLKFKTSAPTDWEYLAISGCYLAIFRGSGTINGAGNYGILVSQTDKDRVPSVANRMRVKIWDKSTGNVIFDTQQGASDNEAPTLTISNGSIQVHVLNGCTARLDENGIPMEGLEASVYPNPVNSNMIIDVQSSSDEIVHAEVYDMLGKLIYKVPEITPNSTLTVQCDFPVGVYFLRITQGENSQMMKFAKE